MAEPRFDTFNITTPAIIDANITQVAVTDQDGDPNQVIETNGTFTVQVDWLLTGLLQPALGGQWNVHVFAEKIGPGEDAELFQTAVALNPATTNYSIVTPPITQPRDTLNNILDGTYALSVVITHSNGGFRTHMAGFLEGPVLQFYTTP